MAAKEITALMALRMYEQGVTNIENLPDFPYDGWGKLVNPLPVTNGFAYGVFRNTATNEVVISYRGTDGAGGMMGYDGLTNIGLTLGVSTAQLIQAARIYSEVVRLYGADANGSNISFTGHSLGGGLAGVMAVYFNRPAIVFDPAPFQLSAFSATAIQDVVQALGAAVPAALLAYQTDRIASFASRELAVASHFVEGEFLNVTRSSANTIYGSNTSYEFGNQAGEVSAFTMHSQALLVTGLLSESFRQATVTVQAALPVIMNLNYYSQDPARSSEKNFLIDLIRSEQANAGNGKLSHFAADLHRLGQDLSGLNAAAQKAIVAQGVEWYYWQGTNYAGQEFSTRSGALLQYSTAQGDNLPGAQDRSKLYVTPWLTEVALAHGTTLFPNFGTQQQWNVATAATTAVAATAREQDESQIFIGRGGNDTFTGGRRADVIFAGAGNDSLNGGQGNDQLYGGTGNDLYQFTGAWGKDLITDTDRSGSIEIDGIALQGVAKGSGQLNTWVGELGAGSGVFVGMTVYDDPRSSTGKRLVIVKGADTANTITINNFDLTQAQGASGFMGIRLDPARRIVVKEAAGGINTWSDARFEASSLAGQSSSVLEGGAKSFTVYLNQAAKAGETLTLSLSALADKFKALVTPAGSGTPSVVNAQGAVIALAAGQTQVSFALLQEGAVSADASAQLSVRYTPAQGSVVQSNNWAVNLKDAGAVALTRNSGAPACNDTSWRLSA